MRTDLDHLPATKQRELGRVVEILRDSFAAETTNATMPWKKEAHIQRIVLYGSYARGEQTNDLSSGYFSDFDLLIVVSHMKLTDPEYWYKAEDRLMELTRTHSGFTKTESSLIVHTLHEVNDKLAMGQYFFSDIVKEGIVLYETGGTKPFAKSKVLTPEAGREISKDYFEQWFESATEFFEGYKFYIGRGSNNIAAFSLHQATERLYACLLLTLTHYTPSTHNIKELRSRCEAIAPTLIPAWSRDTKLARRNFQLLKRAYIEARYSKHYTITREELDWLGERVAVLTELVEKACRERLSEGN